MSDATPTVKIYFNIRNQTIYRVDRMRTMSRSHDYLVAHFDFLTDEWSGLSKIAIFTKDNTSYKVAIDGSGDALVPWEHLEDIGTIEVSVYGGDLVTVNTAPIVVEESGYTDEAINEQPPTPEVWAQLLQRIDNIDGGSFDDWKEGEN